MTSFVSEILLPPLSLLPFINRNMEEKFAVLKRGQGYHHNGTHGYNTMDQALGDGAVIMAYGYVPLFLLDRIEERTDSFIEHLSTRCSTS